MRAILSILALFLMSPLAHAAEDDQPARSVEELRTRIEKIVQEGGVPAIGIALVNQDGPYWIAGWGKADLASGRAADENTLFRIGSISKMFAAFSVLKLVEEGKLSLDDKLRDRAPDLEYANPWESTHPVRIVHLLEHTTGWDDTHLPEYAFDAPDTMSIKGGLDFHPHSRTSRWPPGTRHSYCNSGTAAAAYVVEKVTGRRYEDYVAENFFVPLGMDSTSYFRTPAYESAGATLYLGVEPQPYWGLIHRAAGSINSSSRDMTKLVQFLLRRGATQEARLLAEASIDRMEVPHSTLGATVGVTSGYGLANFSTGHKNLGIAFHGHNGGVMGGLSDLGYVEELGQGYVVMINNGNGAALGRITTQIKDYLLRDRQAPPPTAAKLPAEYREIDGYYVPINPRQQSLRFISNFASVMAVTHDENALHRSPLMGSWVSSDRIGDGRALIDAWHGLPAIARVEDPLVGPALQIGSDIFQRVAGWKVFSRIVVPLVTIVMTLVGVVAIIVWGVRRASGTSTDRRLLMRLWPLCATVALIAFLFSLMSVGRFLNQAGTISPLSIAIFVLSLAYPLLVLLGTFELFRPAIRASRNLPYWFATAFVLCHLLVAGYLGWFGAFGIRTWS